MAARRMLPLLALAVLLALAAPAGAEDASDLPTDAAPAQAVLATASEVRGPGEPAVRVTLAHDAPGALEACGRECGRLSLRVEFTADGTQLPAVTLNGMHLMTEPIPVRAPEALAAGDHRVDVTATLTYAPGTEPPGGAYRVTLSDPYVAGQTFSETTKSPLPGALAGLGVVAVGGVLLGHYRREVR